MARSLSLKVKALNGSVTAVSFRPVIFASVAASFSWSNGGRFWPVSASTSTNSFPPFTDRLYQKR